MADLEQDEAKVLKTTTQSITQSLMDESDQPLGGVVEEHGSPLPNSEFEATPAAARRCI